MGECFYCAKRTCNCDPLPTADNSPQFISIDWVDLDPHQAQKQIAAHPVGGIHVKKFTSNDEQEMKELLEELPLQQSTRLKVHKTGNI